MLVFDPNLRINANEALRCAYFNEYKQHSSYSLFNTTITNTRASAITNINITSVATQPNTTTLRPKQSQNSAVGISLDSIVLNQSSLSLLTSSSSEDQSPAYGNVCASQSSSSLPVTH